MTDPVRGRLGPLDVTMHPEIPTKSVDQAILVARIYCLANGNIDQPISLNDY